MSVVPNNSSGQQQKTLLWSYWKLSGKLRQQPTSSEGSRGRGGAAALLTPRSAPGPTNPELQRRAAEQRDVTPPRWVSAARGQSSAPRSPAEPRGAEEAAGANESRRDGGGRRGKGVSGEEEAAGERTGGIPGAFR